jgi:hypothetical protein
MNTDTRSHTGTEAEPDRERDGEPDSTVPEITVCESGPSTSVFLESGNTEGWIASDTTLEVTR